MKSINLKKQLMIHLLDQGIRKKNKNSVAVPANGGETTKSMCTSINSGIFSNSVFYYLESNHKGKIKIVVKPPEISTKSK